MELNPEDFVRIGRMVSQSTDSIVDTHMNRMVFLNLLLRFFRDKEEDFDVAKFLESTRRYHGEDVGKDIKSGDGI